MIEFPMCPDTYYARKSQHCVVRFLRGYLMIEFPMCPETYYVTHGSIRKSQLCVVRFLRGKPYDQRCHFDGITARNQIFLPLGKKESSAAKGCTGSLAALKGRSCICAALRPHMSYLL